MFDEEPDGDPHGECRAEIHRLTAELAAARAEVDCGQDGPCAKAPGCARHWQERNRALVAELAAARAVPADVEAAILTLVGVTICEISRPPHSADDPSPPMDVARNALRTAIARAISDATDARGTGTVGGLLATACEGEIVEFASPDGMYHQAVIAGGRLLSRRWQHALSHSPGDWTLYAFWLDGAYLRLPARLVPAAEADADPDTRGPLPKGG